MLVSTLFSVALPMMCAQTPPNLHPAFTPRAIELPDKTTHKYAIFLPADYEQNAEKKWPVILFLHGSGEIGTDGVMQTTVGLPPFIARERHTFEFVTIMPQAQSMWFLGKDEAAIWLILDKELKALNVDPDRIYITGLSMGGFATWDLICKRPDVFAAAAPVCGNGNPAVVSNAKRMPIWAFHGDKDQAVPVAGSRAPVDALRLLGAQPVYTEYANAEHAIWDTVYRTERLYSWLLSHKRQAPPSSFDYIMMAPTAQVWWLSLVAGPTDVDQAPRAAMSVSDDGKIFLNTFGVKAWAIASTEAPLKPGMKVEMTWNGKAAFKGKFPGVLTYSPEPKSKKKSKPTTERGDAGTGENKSGEVSGG